MVNYPQLQITPSTMEMILLLIVSIIIPTTHRIILLLTMFSAGDWIQIKFWVANTDSR